MAIDYTSKVAAGIELLDSKSCCVYPCSNSYPVTSEWRKKIDGKRLKTEDGTACILGQLFGSYSTGLSKLDVGIFNAANYGFTTGGTYNESHEELTEAWLKALGLEAKNAPLKVGDVRKDGYGYTGRVDALTAITVNGEATTAVVFTAGFVKSSGSNKVDEGSLSVMTQEKFNKVYSEPVAVVPEFVFEPGTFITNDEGKVYFVSTSTMVREVADQAYAIGTEEISQKGLKKLETPAGADFGQYVGNRIRPTK